LQLLRAASLTAMKDEFDEFPCKLRKLETK